MVYAKFDQPVDQLRLPPRLLWDLEAAQRGELNVDVANLSGSSPDAAQKFQELFLVAISIGQKLLQQGLQTAAAGPEIMNDLWGRLRGNAQQIALHLAENPFTTLGR